MTDNNDDLRIDSDTVNVKDALLVLVVRPNENGVSCDMNASGLTRAQTVSLFAQLSLELADRLTDEERMEAGLPPKSSTGS